VVKKNKIWKNLNMPVENDLVLIYLEDQPLSFARIEDISADSKPDWYHVKLLLLQVPPQIVTWILRDVYINGDEFTMNGKRLRMEMVVVPEESEPRKPESEGGDEDGGTKENETAKAKVISLADLKKK
jgi:hypothetical protein